MKFILALIFIILLFSSCSQKNIAYRYFNKDDLNFKSLKYTQKVDIIKNEEIEAFFIITYLNEIEKNKYENTHNFLILLYFSNLENQDIYKNGYNFKLDDAKPSYIEKIEKNNKEYKSFMIKNCWGNYYLVRFNKTNNNKTQNLNLSIEKDNLNKVILNFQK